MKREGALAGRRERAGCTVVLRTTAAAHGQAQGVATAAEHHRAQCRFSSTAAIRCAARTAPSVSTGR